MVLAYGRVSTDQQRDDETINVQVTKLEGTIRVREDTAMPLKDQLKLIDSFYDNGISGTVPLEQRPEGRKLMQRICPRASIDCRGNCGGTGEINQLWITKLDRLARQLQILVDIELWLRHHNVALICMSPGIDTSDYMGRLIFNILASIAEWEREAILDRTRSGKHQKASEGKWVGGRKTLGLKTDEDGYLVVDDRLIERTGEMAYRMVQSIFENIALHGATVVEEARRTGLSERRVGILLHNPRYKGVGGIYKQNGEWTNADKHAPPTLVTPQLWDMAQDALVRNRANSKYGGKPHRTYLLSSLLICCEPYDYISTVDDQGRTRERPSSMPMGLCGRSFSGRHHTDRRGRGGRNYNYYFCTRTLKNLCDANHDGCTARMLPAERTEALVWNIVRRFISNPGELLAEADSGRNELLAKLNQELTHAVEQLARAQTERENVLVSVEQGHRTRESAIGRFRDIDRQIESLEQQRETCEFQIRALNYDELDDQRNAVTLEETRNTLEVIERDDDVERKQALIKAVVRRIEVRNTDGQPRLRIHLRFGGTTQVLPMDTHNESEELPDDSRMLPRSPSKATEHPQREVIVEVAA